MRAARRTLALLIVAALAWAAGFGWFLDAAGREPPTPAHADGIVALTGGADRVTTALQLLAEDRAPLLLISGVGHGAEVAALAHGAGLDPEAVAARVTLGRAATTTAGNAAETATWASAHGMRSLFVVTAGYHMPRALLELGRSLPDVALHPVPVQPPAMRGRRDPGDWRLLAGEYTKFLAVRLGVAPLLRRLPGVTAVGQG